MISQLLPPHAPLYRPLERIISFMSETLSITPLNAERLERARRAAKFTGQTAARVVNSYTSGRDERVKLWEQEGVVWQRRLAEAAATLPNNGEVTAELETVEHEAYTRLLSLPRNNH